MDIGRISFHQQLIISHHVNNISTSNEPLDNFHESPRNSDKLVMIKYYLMVNLNFAEMAH